MKTAKMNRVQCSKCGAWIIRVATNSLHSNNRPPFYCIVHLADARVIDSHFKELAAEIEAAKPKGEEHDA